MLIASVAPVWALLQPRDYLNSYLLVAMILAAIVGVFVAQPAVNLPAFTSFVVDGQSPVPDFVCYHCLWRCVRLPFPGIFRHRFQAD